MLAHVGERESPAQKITFNMEKKFKKWFSGRS